MNAPLYPLGGLLKLAELRDLLFQLKLLILEKFQAKAYTSREEYMADVYRVGETRARVTALEKEIFKPRRRS